MVQFYRAYDFLASGEPCSKEFATVTEITNGIKDAFYRGSFYPKEGDAPWHLWMVVRTLFKQNGIDDFVTFAAQEGTDQWPSRGEIEAINEEVERRLPQPAAPADVDATEGVKP